MNRARAVGLFGLVVGVSLIVQGMVVATPTGPKCIQTCENRSFYIDGSSGKCYKYNLPDCTICAALPPCQCQPAIAYRDVAGCTRTQLQTDLYWYNSGTCSTPCSTVLSPGYTEAIDPGIDGNFVGALALWQCP